MEALKTYRLDCESRSVNAIGMPDHHVEYVEALSEQHARVKFRDTFDYSKREHLLIRNVKEV